ncbi:hypothetical protein C7I87_05955 [Mesorhizobium sp. SARCC-RB16n]|nr:hypothetical protein C7I87_05955 [Mesorhizobium sp. SARCC-RB16n]
MPKAQIPMVAIVDDDEAVRMSTVSLMRSAGYDAVAFATGRELLDSTWLDIAACILTDLQIAGHDRSPASEFA